MLEKTDTLQERISNTIDALEEKTDALFAKADIIEKQLEISQSEPSETIFYKVMEDILDSLINVFRSIPFY